MLHYPLSPFVFVFSENQTRHCGKIPGTESAPSTEQQVTNSPEAAAAMTASAHRDGVWGALWAAP